MLGPTASLCIPALMHGSIEMKGHALKVTPHEAPRDELRMYGMMRFSWGLAPNAPFESSRSPEQSFTCPLISDGLQQARGLQGDAVDPTAWEVRMAARYYKLLLKEYALADLSR